MKKSTPLHSQEPTFHIKKNESVAEGFSRAISEQLRAASNHLTSGGEPLVSRVHEARKALKKSRALLRLIRPAIDGVYGEVNAELRGAARGLSELRDTQALADALEQLNKRSSQNTGNRILEDTRERLLQRKREIVREFTRNGDTATVAKVLDQIKARLAAETLAQATTAAVVSAIAQTVRRGRKAFARAQQSGRAEDFHEWRKRAKDLRYQMSFLDHLWPHVLEGYSESARELEQRLGEDHNLSMLREMLTAREDLRKQDLNRVLTIIGEEQQQLRKQAGEIGRLLYAEKPKEWARRIELCWNNR